MLRTAATVALIALLQAAPAFAAVPPASDSAAAAGGDRPVLSGMIPPQTHGKKHKGHGGDPVNVIVVSHRAHFLAVLLKAGWIPADPVTVKSSLKLGYALARHKHYVTAPVSPLFLFGRKQDFAFEKNSANPNKRDHLRIWKSVLHDRRGWPFWAVAITKDVGIGLKKTNHMPTHHIDPLVDKERDMLVSDLQGTGMVAETYTVDGLKPGQYTNGGGDAFSTNGQVDVVLLK